MEYSLSLDILVISRLFILASEVKPPSCVIKSKALTGSPIGYNPGEITLPVTLTKLFVMISNSLIGIIFSISVLKFISLIKEEIF